MAFPAEIAAPNFGAPGFGAPDFDALLLALLHPNFDPVAFSVWIFDVRWYALAYIAGLLLAWAYCRWMAKLPPQRLKPVDFDDFLLWATLGVVIGGRLGYVLFYKPDYYLANPSEVRSEEHTSELQSLMRISYAVFCLK